jgi:hypothetical protein
MEAPYAGFAVVGLMLLFTLAVALRRDPARLGSRHVVPHQLVSRAGRGSPVLGGRASPLRALPDRSGVHVPCGRALWGRRRTLFLCTAIDLATLVAAGAHLNSGAIAATRLAPADTGALASRLSGTWSGNQVESRAAEAHPFTMTWKQAPDGETKCRVAQAHGQTYTTSVVWSSDTAFITESVPHKSPDRRVPS